MDFAAFHFLRPEWFWALLPLAVLGWFVVRNRASRGSDTWARLVDSHLLQHLAISGAAANRSRLVPFAGVLAALAVIVGLAGPTWQENDVPSFEGGAPVVTVLSLAQSMNADDLKPTRLKRSVHKVRDVLERTQGDERGLVIYADTPFVAAPLTSDPRVIEEMLPELSTSLMPVLGNRLDLAIAEAQAMLERAGAVRGQILVMADDVGNDPTASISAARDAARAGYRVSVLGAGTEEGARLQDAAGRAISDRDGQTFVTKLSKDRLEEIAQAGGGTFSMITPGSGDLDRVLPDDNIDPVVAGDQQDFQADAWRDMGYWLLLLPVLLAPFAFRRGVIFAVALVMAGAALQPGTAQAGAWDDLWATPDQQGRAAFEADKFEDAATLFDAPDWAATAAYRAGDFATAARGFVEEDYNLGNALAKSGNFEAALAAYDAALEANPKDEDARFNRDLIAKLLEDQQQDQQDQQQDQQQSQDQQGGEQSQDQQGGEQSQDQQGGEQSQDQQGGEQSQDQQGGEQSQDQEGGEQSQDQEGGEQSQDQQGGEQSRDQQGSEQAQDQQGSEQAQGQSDGEPSDVEEVEEKGLAERLTDLLSNDSEEEPQEMVEGSAPGAQPLNQAVEQQLRRVPDDPSGLLRARIRQHYSRLRSGN